MPELVGGPKLVVLEKPEPPGEETPKASVPPESGLEEPELSGREATPEEKFRKCKLRMVPCEEEEETTPTPTPTPSNEKGGAATPQSEKSKDSEMMSLEEDPVVEEEKGEDKNNGDQEGKGGDVEDMEE